ncbi:hypothetical protein BDR05DRAFT_109939 [Suillus weaverae]|nr:hypothetical protein BDR05DRAFT_109939 [Suillus weaverae]
MRFPFVLAVVAALTVSISAMPAVADTSISASETNTQEGCPGFCTKSSQCCGDCVSSLRPGFDCMTHRRDSSSFFAFSVYVVSVWLMARRVIKPRLDARPLGVGFEGLWWWPQQSAQEVAINRKSIVTGCCKEASYDCR